MIIIILNWQGHVAKTLISHLDRVLFVDSWSVVHAISSEGDVKKMKELVHAQQERGRPGRERDREIT